MTELICITCPRGCHLEVDENLNVTGNFCPRGAIYAKKELTAPERSLTSFVRCKNGKICSVKTSSPIPKAKIFDVEKELSNVNPEGKIKIGDVIIKNVCDLGIDIVATRNID